MGVWNQYKTGACTKINIRLIADSSGELDSPKLVYKHSSRQRYQRVHFLRFGRVRHMG